jgi:TPR repeat protein
MKLVSFLAMKIYLVSSQIVFSQGFDKGFGAYMLGNYSEAIIEWRHKASLGSATAMANLGNMYEVGAGVEKDKVLSHQWYNLAASNGDVAARKNKKNLEHKMTQLQITNAIRQAKKCMLSGYLDCE